MSVFWFEGEGGGVWFFIVYIDGRLWGLGVLAFLCGGMEVHFAVSSVFLHGTFGCLLLRHRGLCVLIGLWLCGEHWHGRWCHRASRHSDGWHNHLRWHTGSRYCGGGQRCRYSCRHRIRNLSPGGLRPSTLPLGHGGSPQY